MIYQPNPEVVAKVSARNNTAVAVPVETLKAVKREGSMEGNTTCTRMAKREAPRLRTESI